MKDSLHVLLVEDNQADAEIVRHFLSQCDVESNVTIVDDGEDALDILRYNAKFSPALRPDLILLDLNLPRMGGFEVLEELNSDGVLREIPVVILTASDNESDRTRAQDLRVRQYITKPKSSSEFASILSSIEKSLIDQPALEVSLRDA